MTEQIGIIGCGWLGLPLAEELHTVGYTVSGTTTSKDKISLLKEKGITPYKISITEKQIDGPMVAFLKPLSLLIINIPPRLRGNGPKESYVDKITLLHSEIKKSNVKKVIFVSSTSVYGNTEGTITEKTTPAPITDAGKQLLASENLFRKDHDIRSTIIRFGGLIGPDRHPVTILSGREELKGGNAPVNLIHLDDCIGIIKAILQKGHWGKILNGVYPYHPTKKHYYTQEALKKGLKPPGYALNNHSLHKLVTTCSSFLINKYEFLTSIN